MSKTKTITQTPLTMFSPLSRWHNRWLKRATDILLSTVLLLTVFPPIYLIVAIVIKATSHGPVLDQQSERVLDTRTLCHRQCRLLRFRLRENTIVRTTHIDRWPRLINILAGTISFAHPTTSPADVYSYLRAWSPIKDIAYFKT